MFEDEAVTSEGGFIGTSNNFYTLFGVAGLDFPYLVAEKPTGISRTLV